jgi:hypothetical protein
MIHERMVIAARDSKVHADSLFCRARSGDRHRAFDRCNDANVMGILEENVGRHYYERWRKAPAPARCRATLISHGSRRVFHSAIVATAAATTAAATTTATTAASGRAAATTAAAAALAAATALATATTALTAATTLATATTGTPGGATHHGIRGRAKAMIRRTAEGVKDGYNNEGNSDYKESILGGILPRLLSPEPFEDRQHGNTFDSEETLGIKIYEKTTGNNIPQPGAVFKGDSIACPVRYVLELRRRPGRQFSPSSSHFECSAGRRPKTLGLHSFVPQSHHRIDAGGAACGDVAGS